MARFVVSGGAGFVGSHLCRALVARGDEVVALDNLCTGARRNVADLLAGPRFTLIEHDVIEPVAVEGAVDGVLHLASPASPFDYLKLPLETLLAGSRGTQHLLDLARAKGARFLITSTSEVYGDPEVHPQREDYWGHVNPIGPRSVYDEAKRYAEALTMCYHRSFGVDTRIVRLFNTYGPQMRVDDGRVVPAFLAQAIRGEPMTVFGDGSQSRSFCFVADTVAGILGVFASDHVGPVNIGNPVEFTVLEFAQLVQRQFGVDVPIRTLPLPEDDPRVRQPDISLARRLFGFEPRVTLAQGLVPTYAWFRGALGA